MERSPAAFKSKAELRKTKCAPKPELGNEEENYCGLICRKRNLAMNTR